jgi:RND superfamily putative drug exporter
VSDIDIPSGAAGDRPQSGSTHLGKIIRFAKWPVVLLWIIAAVVATPLAERLGEVESEDAAAFLPSGFDSTQVATLLEADQERSQTQTAIVIYRRDDAAMSDADLATVEQGHRAAAAIDLPAAGAPGPVQVSDDRRAALFTVEVGPTDQAEAAAQVVERLRASTQATATSGLQVYVAGDPALEVDNDAGDVDTALLLTSMTIVAVLLLLTYRSPLLWLVPLFAAVLAVQVARGAAYGLAEAGLTVTELSTAILIVLVFGAATDYALLLLNRYREELTRHPDRHEAVAEALRRTGPTLAASAGTVIAGLLCLLFARLAGLSGLGPVAATGVVVALVAMLTLLPAILACTGRWLLWPRAPRPDRPRGGADHRVWARLAEVVTGRPRPAAAVVTVLLAAAVLGLTSLHTSADPLDKVPPGSESVAGQRILAAHFPPGMSAPLTVVLPAGAGSADIGEARQAAAGDPHVADVSTSEPLQGRPVLSVQLGLDPYSEAAADATRDLRARMAGVDENILVGGSPAVQADYQAAAVRDTWTVMPLVLIAVALILGLLLRSLVAPVVLVGTVVLSFAAALGLSSLVFTHLLGYGGVAADLVIYVFVFLVALGVDYNIFLMDRIREQRRGAGTAAAVRQGLTATGGVITAAGLVLAGTFSALAQLPDVTVAQVGIAVAVGVLIDTLIVRTVQVPALVTILGDRVWWPSRYRRPASPPDQMRKDRAAVDGPDPNPAVRVN